jgi:alanyl-tRNA synthetase
VDVIDTKKENNLFIHFTTELPNSLEGAVFAKVNTSNRKNISAHHSATHLLHAALRQVLGSHVAQKGSLVNATQLRFDFSHFAKVSDDEMKQIENIVNEKIRENIPVVIKEMTKDEAVGMGAMALFGEKYGDTVRVVMMDPNYSIELCGGTHVGGTGELGLFKLKHESAVAAGVRRIEAVCGEGATTQVNEALAELETIKELVKNSKEPVKAVQQMVTDLQSLKKRIESYEALALVGIKKELASKVIRIGDTHFVGAVVTVGNPDGLKKLCAELQASYTNLLVVLVANIEGKAAVAVLVDDTLQASKGLEAQKIIKDQIAPIIKGGGGGQKGLATAGGQDPSNLTQVIETVKSLLN